MEDMKQFLKPPVKEQIRLLLAITIYHTKPPSITLEGQLALSSYVGKLKIVDYLANLRLQVYSTRHRDQVDLGNYTPLSETDDLRGLVGMLMRRVESLESEREQERERKRQRVEVKVEEEEEEW